MQLIQPEINLYIIKIFQLTIKDIFFMFTENKNFEERQKLDQKS